VRTLTPLLAEVSILANKGKPDAGEELALRMATAALCLGRSSRDFSDPSPRDQQRIAEALRIIESRFTEPFSISTLASDVGMSRYHFLRTFQRVTGETPWRYIVNRRLAIAAEHLLTASGTVLDAVLASGFGDLSEFTRRFRLQFGVSDLLPIRSPVATLLLNARSGCSRAVLASLYHLLTAARTFEGRTTTKGRVPIPVSC
jgi:AraC-like DNA-binding protein